MPRLRWKAAGLLMATAAVLLVAACGGSGSKSASAGTTTAGGTGRSNAFAAYVDCLNQNGVTIALPSGGPRTRPSGGPRNRPSGGARPSGMPRPSGGTGRGGFPGGGGFGGGGFFAKPANVDDATWQKAQQACASVRPSFGPGNRQGGGAQNAAFQNCMKDHGVTNVQNLSTTDPTVKKALDVCRVLRQSQPSATPAA